MVVLWFSLLYFVLLFFVVYLLLGIDFVAFGGFECYFDLVGLSAW